MVSLTACMMPHDANYSLQLLRAVPTIMAQLLKDNKNKNSECMAVLEVGILSYMIYYNTLVALHCIMF